MPDVQSPGALRDSSRAYFEAALDCVIVADASGCVVEFNPAAERTFGYSREQALGRTLAELIVPPSLREHHRRAFARFVATGEQKAFGRRLELTGMRADGSEFPVELTLTLVEGERLLVCGAVRDITNAKLAETRLRRLADEQTALRHVATLVARATPPADVFAAVAEEAAAALDVPLISVVRFERDGSAVQVGTSGAANPFPVGTRWTLDEHSVSGQVARTGRPARVDDYGDIAGDIPAVLRDVGIRSAVGSPIVVDGSRWGVLMALSSEGRPLPDGTEARLAEFTELVATSISNAEARNDLRRLADEQAALRRLATLVAEGPSPSDVFAAVAEEVGLLLAADVVNIVRHESDESASAVASWSAIGGTIPLGTRLPLAGPSIMGTVARTGRPMRIDDYTQVPEAITYVVDGVEIRAGVGVPIMVDGRVWGTVVALSANPAPLPLVTERQLADFTELVATAISNTQARDDLRRLVDEQTGLRRVATLVAREAAPADVFAAVAEQVSLLLGGTMIEIVRCDASGHATGVGAWGDHPFVVGSQWTLDGPSVIASVLETGRPARIDDYSALPGTIAAFAREAGFRSAVGAPIVVDGKTWGVVNAISREPEPLPANTEERLAGFTELVATAISRTEARDAVRKSEELYRRAIAQADAVPYVLDYASGTYKFIGEGIEQLTGYRPEELTHEIFGGLVLETHLHDEQAGLNEWDAAYRTRDGEFEQWRTDIRLRRRDGEVRWLSDASVEIFGDDSRSVGSVGMLQDITDRMRTQDEQAALRRVATLVAREAAPTEVFDAVAAEVARVLEISLTSILRYDPDGTAIKVGGWGVENPYPVGARFPAHDGVITDVWRTGAPARVEDYRAIANPVAERLSAAGIRASVGVPIVVDGRTWGVMVALSTAADSLPADTEARLADFTELVATAIANAQARAELRALVDEQSALRRVATLVASGAESRGVFDAVCEETGRLVDATSVNLAHFTADGFNLTMAGWSARDTHVPTGTRLPLEGETINAMVRRTRAPGRVDSYERLGGELAALIRRRGIRSEIGAPVIVEGEVWGALIAGWDTDELAPEGTELRLASFAELIATAVSNASNRAELVASRARIVAAADDARRRIERDLHDGTQQQLVSLGLELKAVQAGIPAELRGAHADLDSLREALDGVVDEVREISRGVHPATLTQWGVGPALRALARRSPVPVELELDVPGRLPDSIEIATYYVVSETLANVAKHAHASFAAVRVAVSDGRLRVEIRDDGVGGADTRRGSGLTGLVDRVEALGGLLALTSPPQEGTTLVVSLPLEAPVQST